MPGSRTDRPEHGDGQDSLIHLIMGNDMLNKPAMTITAKPLHALSVAQLNAHRPTRTDALIRRQRVVLQEKPSYTFAGMSSPATGRAVVRQDGNMPEIRLRAASYDVVRIGETVRRTPPRTPSIGISGAGCGQWRSWTGISPLQARVCIDVVHNRTARRRCHQGSTGGLGAGHQHELKNGIK